MCVCLCVCVCVLKRIKAVSVFTEADISKE